MRFSLSNRQAAFMLLAGVLIALFSSTVFGQGLRMEVGIPDIDGYQTLACDFHMHTMFSDGSVWPTVRVDEAWREGLDVIAITDHIEYRPHRDDVSADPNRPYEIARSSAEALVIILIRGTEITRGEPMGHHNAIFLTDVKPLVVPDSIAAIQAAADQDAFIFWNHPGWKQPDRKGVWSPIQSLLMERELIDGMEVVNSGRYDPNVHQWCIDYDLTMLGNSDEHGPTGLTYDFAKGEHRPMTLVFTKEKTAEEVRKALDKRRTVVYWKNNLAGDEKYLKAIFEESTAVLTSQASITGNGWANISITNTSCVPYVLEADGESEYLTFPRRLTLPANRTVMMRIQRKDGATVSGNRRTALPYRVTNLITGPGEYLAVEITVRVEFISPEEADR